MPVPARYPSTIQHPNFPYIFPHSGLNQGHHAVRPSGVRCCRRENATVAVRGGATGPGQASRKNEGNKACGIWTLHVLYCAVLYGDTVQRRALARIPVRLQGCASATPTAGGWAHPCAQRGSSQERPMPSPAMTSWNRDGGVKYTMRRWVDLPLILSDSTTRAKREGNASLSASLKSLTDGPPVYAQESSVSMQIGLLTSFPLWGWQAITSYAFVVPLLFLLSWWTVSHARSPLRKYPGPFLASTCLSQRQRPTRADQADTEMLRAHR